MSAPTEGVGMSPEARALELLIDEDVLRLDDRDPEDEWFQAEVHADIVYEWKAMNSLSLPHRQVLDTVHHPTEVEP